MLLILKICNILKVENYDIDIQASSLKHHTSIGFCVFRLHKTTILGTLLKIVRRSLRNVPKNGTTLHVGMSNARLTASQYCGVFSLELNASVRNLKPGISSVIVSHSGRNASILN